MKALILAAGLGTRLLPYSKRIPKPLFTLLSQPVLAHAICRLKDAGCTQIVINTHHLHQQIEKFIQNNDFEVDIRLIHEPDILETGGAIANARSYLKKTPFFVVNADVFSTIDLKKTYEAHRRADCLATLVLHDENRFNKVGLDEQGFITNFHAESNGLAFTGIQVLSPEIYDHLPPKEKFSSIEVYQELCSQKLVKAFIQKDIFWSDIGTEYDYQQTSLLLLSAGAFDIPQNKVLDIEVTPLAGDGSDRRWYRSRHKQRSKIISDHGICLPETENFLQLNAFVHIGNHLHSKGLCVPRIIDHDTLSGMVLLEDLGDVHLEQLINKKLPDKHTDSDTSPALETFTQNLYQKVIDQLIDFSNLGAEGFDKQWTCQSETYSKELILDKECRYFIEAFVRDYLKLDQAFDDFTDEFGEIADQALAYGHTGLMHRDMQSRNIMLKDEQIFFIDFQSARIGPLQYDLASLLIDPYVNLSEQTKKVLLKYAIEKLSLNPLESKDFSHSFNYCALSRNLQFLGAFSFLSQKKHKTYFEQYIPGAVISLDRIINTLDTKRIPKLQNLVKTITGVIKNGKN